MVFPLLAAGGAGPHIDPAYLRRVFPCLQWFAVQIRFVLRLLK